MLDVTAVEQGGDVFGGDEDPSQSSSSSKLGEPPRRPLGEEEVARLFWMAGFGSTTGARTRRPQRSRSPQELTPSRLGGVSGSITPPGLRLRRRFESVLPDGDDRAVFGDRHDVAPVGGPERDDVARGPPAGSCTPWRGRQIPCSATREGPSATA